MRGCHTLAIANVSNTMSPFRTFSKLMWGGGKYLAHLLMVAVNLIGSSEWSVDPTGADNRRSSSGRTEAESPIEAGKDKQARPGRARNV